MESRPSYVNQVVSLLVNSFSSPSLSLFPSSFCRSIPTNQNSRMVSNIMCRDIRNKRKGKQSLYLVSSMDTINNCEDVRKVTCTFCTKSVVMIIMVFWTSIKGNQLSRTPIQVVPINRRKLRFSFSDVPNKLVIRTSAYPQWISNAWR